MSKSTRISLPGMGKAATRTGILAGILFFSASLWTGCQNDGPTQNSPSHPNTNTATLVAAKCASDLDPVCGCDGKPYVNACQAMGIGHVYVASKGACPGDPIVD